MINDFHTRGYEFLSNFSWVEVGYRGVKYPSVEHAFQAAKTLILAERELIRACRTPHAAKRLGGPKAKGGIVTLRHDWDKIKLDIMLYLLRQKFSKPELKAKLLATGDQELVEGNKWHDTFWGVCNGIGSNHLGRLLMQVRSELQDIQATIGFSDK